MNAPGKMKLAREVLEHFAQFVAGDSTLAAFEYWVYHTPGIADIIGYDNYFRLLDVDYRLPSAVEELPRLVARLADQVCPGELVREQVRLVLCGLVTGTINLFDACDRLLWWRNHGEEWISLLFVGIAAELDDVPRPPHYHQWDSQALTRKLAEVEPWIRHYHALAQAEAQQLLAAEFADRPCTSAEVAAQ